MSKDLINDIDNNCWSWQHCAWYVLQHSDTTLQSHPHHHQSTLLSSINLLLVPFRLSGFRQFLTRFLVGYFADKYVHMYAIWKYITLAGHIVCGVKRNLTGKSTVGFPFGNTIYQDHSAQLLINMDM